MMLEPDAESMPAEQLAGLQEERLRGLVDRLLAADGVQAERLRSAGVTSGGGVGLSDLPRLPMTEKKDLWDGYPLRMLGVDRSEVVALHGSSGTGGRPTLVGYTRSDLRLWARMCARALAAAGAGPGSLIHNAYGYGLFTGGLGIHQGAIELGATVLPISGGMTPRQVTLIRDLQPDVLTCTPSYAIRLGEALADAGLRPGAGLALRAGVFGAEPWSVQLRTRIEELLGLRALDIYGLSEVIGPGVAAECAEAADGLHVNEDHFLAEAVDPVTAEPVPDGTPGELVFSTLTREAGPLLRYRTGDIAALRRGPCPCGRTLVKMSQVTGRRDDMLVIRGVNIYPSEVERVLLGHSALSPDYLLVVDERAAQPQLLALCEYAPDGAGPDGAGPDGAGLDGAGLDGAGLDGAGLDGAGLDSAGPDGASPDGAGRDGTGRDGVRGTGPAEADLELRLREVLGVRVGVRVLPGGTLPRTEVGKAVRVIRWTGGEPPVPGIS